MTSNFHLTGKDESIKMLNDFLYASYEITPLTLAVIPKQNKNGTISAYVLEESRDYLIDYSPMKVIDAACKYFGSSLKGRMDGTRDVSNITHKPPIAIDPASGMYFFPTNSPVNSKCTWIAHSHIDTMKSVDLQQTKITFKNGKSIIVDVSYGSIMNQIQRTAQFRYALDHRIKLLHSAMDKRTRSVIKGT